MTVSAVAKPCTKCGEVKPLDAFSAHPTGRYGRQPQCRACRSAWDKQARLDNPERYRAYGERQRDNQAAWKRKRYEEDRNRVLDHYGRSCACCGSQDRLEVDHVGGRGNAHREELTGSGSGVHLYRWLAENDFPPGFQVLCLPCNRAKAGTERCWLDHGEGAPSCQEQMLARRREYQRQYNKTRDVSTGYRALHLRVRTARGRAADYPCTHEDESCRGAVQWANISGEYLDVDDFMPLCRFHHRAYDAPVSLS